MQFLTRWRNRSPYEKCLLLLFAFTIPLVNPWVRGDGVGYYAYARALLIEKRLDFEKDWLEANESYRLGRVGADGRILPDQYTSTGHLDNHFSVGPAILWSPFLATAHVLIKFSDAFGARIPATGFSWPYTTAMAFGTAIYGFLGLWLSFRIAGKLFKERWAFLATLGIWFGSSLPVYLYFNPSWSHAHSAFIVALFLSYWQRIQNAQRLFQWAVLGLLGGLMIDVYYANVFLLILPLVKSLHAYKLGLQNTSSGERSPARVFGADVVFLVFLLLAFSPMLISRWVIYGSPFSSGYISVAQWNWTSPVLGSLLFSADHGLLSWTPILTMAVAGLISLAWRDRSFGGSLLLVFVAFYYFIASYPDWDGISSFGNRFFISLTPLFVIGLACFFHWLGRVWSERRASIVSASVTSLLIAWNLGLIFQWGTHLIPARGPISWREAAHNQVAVVPAQIIRTFEGYVTGRHQMMRHIEQQDLKQLRSE